MARRRSWLRLCAMALVGILTGLAVGIFGSWAYAAVAGWAAACVVYTGWVWISIWRMNPQDTKAHATQEDPARPVADLLVLAASVGSLGAVILVLVQGRSTHGIGEVGLALLAVLSVALSWTLVHTLYTLRYARVYYADPVGGIDFNQEEPPRYSDFAYLSFDLGMTFQVSDTTLRSSDLRSIVLRHTLLSYIFGSVILATTINLVAGLSSGG